MSAKPRIVLNMTTLNQGGVIQRAVSFVDHLDSVLNEFDWHLLLSKKMQSQLELTNTNTSFPARVFDSSPAKSLSSRRLVADSIHSIGPQMVFTFGGPSYLRLTAPELMGVTDGWVTHADAEAFRSIPKLRNRWGLKLASRYKLQWIRKATHLTTQTETARQGLATRANFDVSRVHIIPNALANWYRNIPINPGKPDPDQKFRIVYFAAAYSHKRHDILPEVCKRLEQLGLGNFEILITLPEENSITKGVVEKAASLGVSRRIKNLGPLPATDGVQLYLQSHICFMPTVLETFSATYLEGMATQTPIVTSDRNFAKEICGGGAAYFEPSNAQAAAEKIYEIATRPDVRNELIANGLRQLKVFPDVSQQMNLYRELLVKLLDSPEFCF